MATPQMYILRWGVNPSHLCNDTIVYGYRNACDAYNERYASDAAEYKCVVLVKLNFDSHGFVSSRSVKMFKNKEGTPQQNVNLCQLIQEGKL